MDELTIIQTLSYVMIALGLITFRYLTSGNNKAPYGRYADANRALMSVKIDVNARVAWFLQELPSFGIPFYFAVFTNGDEFFNLTNKLLLGMFLLHYFHRTFVFSLLIRGGKPTPLITFLAAVLFCSYNGYLQGRYLTEYGEYPEGWRNTTCFQIGALMFIVGMVINIHSDYILRNLRKPGETDYKIPMGGMFEYVSGANFLGEMLEWTGYAVASWSLPTTAFAVFTCCNIGPRALTHHKWYLEKFGKKYPRSRKAVIPFIL